MLLITNKMGKGYCVADYFAKIMCICKDLDPNMLEDLKSGLGAPTISGACNILHLRSHNAKAQGVVKEKGGIPGLAW